MFRGTVSRLRVLHSRTATREMDAIVRNQILASPAEWMTALSRRGGEGWILAFSRRQQDCNAAGAHR